MNEYYLVEIEHLIETRGYDAAIAAHMPMGIKTIGERELMHRAAYIDEDGGDSLEPDNGAEAADWLNHSTREGEDTAYAYPVSQESREQIAEMSRAAAQFAKNYAESADLGAKEKLAAADHYAKTVESGARGVEVHPAFCRLDLGLENVREASAIIEQARAAEPEHQAESQQPQRQEDAKYWVLIGQPATDREAADPYEVEGFSKMNVAGLTGLLGQRIETAEQAAEAISGDRRRELLDRGLMIYPDTPDGRQQVASVSQVISRHAQHYVQGLVYRGMGRAESAKAYVESAHLVGTRLRENPEFRGLRTGDLEARTAANLMLAHEGQILPPDGDHARASKVARDAVMAEYIQSPQQQVGRSSEQEPPQSPGRKTPEISAAERKQQDAWARSFLPGLSKDAPAVHDPKTQRENEKYLAALGGKVSDREFQEIKREPWGGEEVEQAKPKQEAEQEKQPAHKLARSQSRGPSM